MKIKKIPIKPNKIGIDLILCPKTNLYLQDLYCRRCSYYRLDTDVWLECNFTGHRHGKPDRIKDRIIQDLSNSFITELPSNKEVEAVKIKEVNASADNRVLAFTERLQESKSARIESEQKKGLSQYMKKTNLSTRLDLIKKGSLENENEEAKSS
ncbi:MAG: hypothetical protein ACFFD7_01970 [Candidatus Thorarchaeota archaeon]